MDSKRTISCSCQRLHGRAVDAAAAVHGAPALASPAPHQSPAAPVPRRRRPRRTPTTVPAPHLPPQLRYRPHFLTTFSASGQNSSVPRVQADGSRPLRCAHTAVCVLPLARRAHLVAQELGVHALGGVVPLLLGALDAVPVGLAGLRGGSAWAARWAVGGRGPARRRRPRPGRAWSQAQGLEPERRCRPRALPAGRAWSRAAGSAACARCRAQRSAHLVVGGCKVAAGRRGSGAAGQSRQAARSLPAWARHAAAAGN